MIEPPPLSTPFPTGPIVGPWMRWLRSIREAVKTIQEQGGVAVSVAWTAITGKPDTFPPDPHTHPQYLTQETDPTVPVHVKGIAEGQITDWDAAANASHYHSNKAHLDTVNQDLSTASNVQFNELSTTGLSTLAEAEVSDLTPDDPVFAGPGGRLTTESASDFRTRIGAAAESSVVPSTRKIYSNDVDGFTITTSDTAVVSLASQILVKSGENFLDVSMVGSTSASASGEISIWLNSTKISTIPYTSFNGYFTVSARITDYPTSNVVATYTLTSPTGAVTVGSDTTNPIDIRTAYALQIRVKASSGSYTLGTYGCSVIAA